MQSKSNFRAESSLGLLLEVTDEDDPIHDDSPEGEGSQILSKTKKSRIKKKKTELSKKNKKSKKKRKSRK